MKTETVAQALANAILAHRNCVASGNVDWMHRHRARIDTLIRECLPSGSGIDAGVALRWDKCTDAKLVFTLSFHHMNDVGMYDGWTDHTVTAKASLVYKLDVTVSGRDRNDIKEHIAGMFHDALQYPAPAIENQSEKTS